LPRGHKNTMLDIPVFSMFANGISLLVGEVHHVGSIHSPSSLCWVFGRSGWLCRRRCS